MSKSYGCIYLIKNLQNNKVYIGQTINLKERITNHFKKNLHSKTYLNNAIKKYGKTNFKIIILGYCNSKEELDNAEKECITFFESKNYIYGYNLTNGGEGNAGYKYTDEQKEKLKNAIKNRPGHPVSEYQRQRIIESNKTRTISEETRITMSNANKNRIKLKCPYCDKVCDASNAKRWHFNNCKNRRK